MTVRELTLSLLNDYESNGKYINLSLSSHLTDKLTGEERGFLTALLYTTVERKITYDYYITSISERSIDKIDPTTLNILRIGMCQIADMDSIPDHAAVNATVKLARNVGERGFVNGVLRRAVRQRDEGGLPLPKREKNLARYLSVRYSYPLWMSKHFISLYGESGAEQLMQRMNTARYTDLTVNLTRTTRDELASRLREQGYNPILHPTSSLTVRIDASVNPRKLYGFDEGLFFVQDVACAVSAEALGSTVGDRIIDVCACPGGKSFAAAILAGGDCEVYSFDLHESKMSLIEDGASRLGLDCIRSDVLDATEPREELYGSFDKVICDVPCSGLGVLAKKPDIRHKDNESLQNLPVLQYDILEKSSLYLKEGGSIVYSTCTLNPDENEEIVEKFLANHPQFSYEDFTVGNLTSVSGMLTMLPHVNESDGFFIAKLRKN